ncbi:MAG: hypothetical protein JXB10_13685 [Pirellulales bacterium]|nr:hypothetical protein [Pirellulales bacterium]
MKKLAFFGVLIGLVGTAFGAAEKPLKTRIASLGLLKNGLAVVQRTAEAEGPGEYRLADVPEPVYGTFWVTSPAPVSCRVTYRTEEAPLGATPSGNFQDGLAGRQVEIRFAEPGLAPVEGKVVEFSAGGPTSAFGAASVNFPSYYPVPAEPGYRAAGGYLVLETAQGTCYVDPQRIAMLQVKGKVVTVKRRRPVLLLHVGDTKQKPGTVTISYLAKGMAWAPSYRLDLTGPKRLTLRQGAVIKNELEPIEDARIALISGYPHVKYGHVPSLLSPRMSWDMFLSAFAQGMNTPQTVVAQQIVAPYPQQETEGGNDPLAMLADRDTDLHFQDVGKLTLGQGDALALETASGEANYESIVLWTVGGHREANRPDAPPTAGIPIFSMPQVIASTIPTSPSTSIADPCMPWMPAQGVSPSGSASGESGENVWDVVRFRNPLKFPMTTAPALIVADGRFAGQATCPWSNPGEEVGVRVGKALNLRVQDQEEEVPGSRKAANVAGKNVLQVEREGTLRMRNLRAQPVTLVVECPYAGELLTSDGDPKDTLLRDDLGSLNQRRQLTWSLKLKPGKEAKRTYRYRHTLTAIPSVGTTSSWTPVPATSAPGTFVPSPSIAPAVGPIEPKSDAPPGK